MADEDHRMVHTVFGNPWVQAILALIGIVVLIFVVYALSFVLIPLILAFLVAYVLDPLVDRFEARHIPRGVAIGGLAAVGLVLLLSLPLFAVPSLIRQAERLGTMAQATATHKNGEETHLEKLLEWTEKKLPLEDFVDYTGLRKQYEERMAQEQTPESATAAKPSAAEGQKAAGKAEAQKVPAQVILADYISRYVKNNLERLLITNRSAIASAGQRAGNTIASLFTTIGRRTVEFIMFLGNLALFAFVAVYLLKDFDRVIKTMGELIPPRWRERVHDVMGKIDAQMRGFLVGQMTVCLCLATLYAIGLFISGVPFAILIAIFGGLASLIPFIGVVLTFMPSAILTLLQYGADWHIIAVLVTFVIVQTLEGNIITPTIMGNKVGLHPVWVILAVMVFGSLLGFKGMIVAVPLSAVLKVIVEEAIHAYKHSHLFTAPESGHSE